MALVSKSAVQLGRRSLNRLPLGLPASLILTHERQACTLENVSSMGACVRVGQPVAKGNTVVLCFHRLRIYTVVIWSHKTLCGLRFEAPLDLEDMQGFLWITQNRDEYKRICLEQLVDDLATGFGN